MDVYSWSFSEEVSYASYTDLECAMDATVLGGRCIEGQIPPCVVPPQRPQLVFEDFRRSPEGRWATRALLVHLHGLEIIFIRTKTCIVTSILVLLDFLEVWCPPSLWDLLLKHFLKDALVAMAPYSWQLSLGFFGKPQDLEAKVHGRGAPNHSTWRRCCADIRGRSALQCWCHWHCLCISKMACQAYSYLQAWRARRLVAHCSSLGNVCMYVCMYACMHACMHACIYVCMYVYTLKFILYLCFLYTHILHTHIYIHTFCAKNITDR